MGHYKSNLRDIEFNLFEVFGRGDVLGQGLYDELDEETARSILREVDRLAREEIAASYESSDRTPPVYDPETHTVTLPEGFKKSYRAYMDAEWFRLGLPKALGGQPTPPSLRWSLSELVLGANPAVHLYSAGPGFGLVLWRNGTDRDKKIARHMVESRRTAAHCTTIVEADLSRVVARRRELREQMRRRWRRP